MKFDPTKFRLPGFFRRLLQNRQMKYVLLAVAFSALIIGAAVIYDELSKRYEQEIQPPVRTEQTMKTKPGTKATNEKKTAETTNEGENTADSSLESAATTGPEKSLEKENRTVDGVKIIYTLNNDLWIPCYKFYVRADLSAADGFTVYNTYTVPCFR